MIETLKTYFEQIKKLDTKDATEHTLRPALHNLLIALAEQKNSKIKVIPEPKRDESGKGAPDVKFKIGESILGYLENKKSDANLNLTLKSAQIEKYKKLSNNLIVTNYLEWIWLRDGVIIERETIANSSDVGNRKAHFDPDKAEKVAKLIENFLSTPPKGIAGVKTLALALATRCHDLREFLTEELIRQDKEHQEGRLFGLFNVFKKDVFHELSLPGFTDAFAQMLGYGLFLARLNSGGKSPITLANAKQFIPVNFELIRELVNFLDELDKPEYSRIKWLIEEILSLMNTLEMEAIHEDLAFTKQQGQLLEQTEEYRLLFSKDPYVYFYEDFLKAYDKQLRKSRGVYYTPPPVVNFIVRAINDILRDTFGIVNGLSDRKRVTVLDFATGTGTFLLEILQQIFDGVSEGLLDQVIREHALKNLYGFEYLIAPYTIAHLKLSQFLQDKGFRMQPKERLQIYLTNTLEPIEPQINYLLPALTREVEDAQKVKEKPILVITGNPPYSAKPQNPSFQEIRTTGKNGKTKKEKIPTFIGKLIESYKFVDGKPLRERNSKWLHDDYVKFIRFAQWKMEKVEDGIVGIITNHSFLDNPTFRGMRQSLMQTFNQIYVFDLHGKNTVKTPDGKKDENVFDIKQGVCVTLLVRKHELERKIFHADVWGKRDHKYRTCMTTTIDEVKWKKVTPSSPFYLFTPQNETLRKAFEEEWQITKIFPVNGVGMTTAHDKFVMDFDQTILLNRFNQFRDADRSKDLHKLFNVKKKKGWNILKAWNTFQEYSNSDIKNKIFPVTYRPFDSRYIIYEDAVVWRTAKQIMDHMVGTKNIGLITARSNKSKDMNHFFVTNYMSEAKTGESSTQSCLFPLYLYNLSEGKTIKTSLFDEEDPFQGKERIENLAPEFRKFLDEKYKNSYSPEEILGYIYAVLHSPTYRKKYLEFMRIDFPRIPFVDNRKTFETLSKLGLALVAAHLLKDIPSNPEVSINKGNNQVDKPVYNSKEQRLYINKTQYFTPVTKDVWNFQIGGYKVLDKYLKYRKGRELTLDENENIINVIKVLRFTIDQMEKIDNVWKPG
ncbi:MAG: type ISP restriction/modification enzyme [Nitrospiria bacterium]